MSEIIRISKVNETYVKLFCNDGIAFEISELFTFTVPGVQFIPAFKKKRWKGEIKLFSAFNRLLYQGLIEKLIEFCNSRNYSVEFDNISDFSNVEFSLIEAKQFIKSLNIPPQFEERDYQIESIVHCIRHSKSLLLSPTSSGKSLMMYILAQYYRKRTLIIVPTINLVYQMSEDFISYGMNENWIHKIKAGIEKETDKPIIISTWQSLDGLNKEWFDKFDVVMVDEVHGAKAKILKEIVSNKLDNCKYKIGLTGTINPEEVSILTITGLFGPAKQVITTRELIDLGYASNLSIKMLVLNHSDEEKKKLFKATYQDEINYLISHKRRNNFIKNLVMSLEGNTLLLFSRVEGHGKILYELIKEHSDDRKVFYIHGEVDGDERNSVRAIVENEKDAIIVASYRTFSTGVSIKKLNNAIFASPSKARITIFQSIGRTLRKTKTKTEATLYDISDDLTYNKKRNYTLNHLVERIKMYIEEKFIYKMYRINL